MKCENGPSTKFKVWSSCWWCCRKSRKTTANVCRQRTSFHCEKSVRIQSFLVLIFQHLDWIPTDTENLSVFSPNAAKCRPEKLWIRIPFTQYLVNPLISSCKKCHAYLNKRTVESYLSMHVLLSPPDNKVFNL